jgi:hypothetical protein
MSKEVTSMDVDSARREYFSKLEKYLIGKGWVVDEHEDWSKGRYSILTAEEAYWNEVSANPYV